MSGSSAKSQTQSSGGCDGVVGGGIRDLETAAPRIGPCAKNPLNPTRRTGQRRGQEDSVQVVREAVVGSREAVVGGVLVRHGQEAADATGHGILRHRGIRVVAEFIEAGVAEPQP